MNIRRVSKNEAVALDTPRHAIILTRSLRHHRTRSILKHLRNRTRQLTITRPTKAARSIPTRLTQVVTLILSTITTKKAIAIKSLPRRLAAAITTRRLNVSQPALVQVVHSKRVTTRGINTRRQLGATSILTLGHTQLTGRHTTFSRLHHLRSRLRRS